MLRLIGTARRLVAVANVHAFGRYGVVALLAAVVPMLGCLTTASRAMPLRWRVCSHAYLPCCPLTRVPHLRTVRILAIGWRTVTGGWADAELGAEDCAAGGLRPFVGY